MYGLPDGKPERNFNITELALTFGATFSARTYSGDIKQMTEILKEAINHKGCSIVEVMQYCPTYNPEASPEWFKDHIQVIEKPFNSKEEAVKASDT
jgi:2-oxoglutarate ferredoxin oxidoreductase subunit beta